MVRTSRPAPASKVDGNATAIAFNAGAARDVLTIETLIPKSLEGDLVARGPDGVARPVQLIGGGDDRPMFEGEFAAREIKQYLGGAAPRTPLFGKSLQGIPATETAPGLVRLDVGLGETPVSAEVLSDAQKRVQPLLNKAEKFKIVMHAGGLVRPALVQAGPAPELGLVPITVVSGGGATLAEAVRARKLDGNEPGIACGPLTVTVAGNG